VVNFGGSARLFDESSLQLEIIAGPSSPEPDICKKFIFDWIKNNSQFYFLKKDEKGKRRQKNNQNNFIFEPSNHFTPIKFQN
jgi:hypothetical protein